MNQKTKHRMISALLCAALVLGIFPVVTHTHTAVAATTPAAKDDPCAEADCTGMYKNGICTSVEGVTHYQAATLEESGDYAEYYKIENAGNLFWLAHRLYERRRIEKSDCLR